MVSGTRSCSAESDSGLCDPRQVTANSATTALLLASRMISLEILVRKDFGEVTFSGILHWAYTCTALLQAALACLLAAVCEVYAGSTSVGEQPFMLYGRTSFS